MKEEIKATVKHLLETVPSLRDSDERLVANVWFIASKGITTANDFFMAYSQGKIPTADWITRARRDIQLKNPELRGELWQERHKKEQEYREEFRELI